MTMGSHQSSRMQSDVWLTPPGILAALGKFDLDPCAAPEPRPWATAARMIALPEDGLAADWTGHRVWLNPPYSREAVKWLRKLSEYGNGTALIFARTETAWFRDYVWKRADGLLFIDGRLHFHDQEGRRAKANAGAPSVLVAYGKDNVTELFDSSIVGYRVRNWSDE